MRAIAAIALCFGAAALVVPLMRNMDAPATAPEQPAVRSQAAIAAPLLPDPVEPTPIEGAGDLAAARERLAAARKVNDPAGFARALRDLEGTLHALSGGISEIVGEARVMEHEIRTEDAAVKRLLASLVSASRAGTDVPPPLHPAGPVAAARAAALLPASGAALRAGATAIRGKLEALAHAQRLRAEGEAALAAGLDAAGEARAALREAVLARAEPVLPGPPDQRSSEAAMIRSSETLSDIAKAVAGPVPAEVEAAAERALVAVAGLEVATDAHVTQSARNLPGSALTLEMPVAGRVLRGFEKPDSAGVPRPGLMLAATPRTVVTAPATGEVRYVGPFLDYDRVVAIAPAAGTVVLLAGLAEVAVNTGDIVTTGTPVGFLGGREMDAQEFLMLPDEGSEALGAETLYMELWRAGEPVDPGPWLVTRTNTQNG